MPQNIVKRGNVTLVFHYGAFDQARKSSGVVAEIAARAARIQAAAGGADAGFEMEVTTGAHRVRASVRTATFEARKAEAVDKVLTAAINAGG